MPNEVTYHNTVRLCIFGDAALYDLSFNFYAAV